MTVDRRALIASVATLALAGAARAENPAPTPAAGDPSAPIWPPAHSIALWPGNPPGMPATPPVLKPTMNGSTGHRELWVRGVATPAIHVFRPSRPNGAALLSIPGGGYEFLSVQNEGLDVAHFYTARGYTVFVLSYRLPAEGWANRANVPLQDAQRAMRLIRANATRFGVDPRRVGIVGFSAGGHLAASLVTAHDEPVYTPVDEADRLSARPDFAGLIYPVTTLETPETHAGSRDHLLGPNPSPKLVAARSPLRHIDAKTPPCFLVHALDDDTVPVACSIDWMMACRAAKVPVEAHLLEHGGHGFGLHLPDDNPGALWPEQFLRWATHHQG
ncbi:alpha/beta hydrolase [Sphingomonas oligoaromativorans]|uniref:alpha/beta hydrolase n=1 Tax=Sphingomonas oligoaromativorans TaxID=575322 RepID=UPI001420C01F|nr:alpha/beta hydrolase [Sphingomonas oligoaromativorans]NIJ32372.1 acetyl esterase/lipase [Sphingomonas oligoaromativorans]